jgi:2-polyprenyl-3-methyl-5-hydroxy-6-metoxy-1,4-benzoquinol methylase
MVSPATCPLCQSDKLAEGYQVTAAEAAQHWRLAEAEPLIHEQLRSHISALWRGSSATAMHCPECDLGFTHPFVAGDATFYAKAFGQSGYPKDRWEYGRTLDSLDGDIATLRVLEIGAGTGQFLEQLTAKGLPHANVVATEYNEIAAATLESKGFQVYDDLSELGRSDTKFDLICMFQVLEHCDEIQKLFRTLRGMLSPSGTLAASVPNGELVRFQEAHGSLLDMPPNHISRWSMRSLECLASHTAFELVEVRTQPFAWLNFIRQDIEYAYRRKAQIGSSIARRLLHLRHSNAGRIANMAAAGLLAPARVPTWLRALRRRAGLGATHWARMKPV